MQIKIKKERETKIYISLPEEGKKTRGRGSCVYEREGATERLRKREREIKRERRIERENEGGNEIYFPT